MNEETRKRRRKVDKTEYSSLGEPQVEIETDKNAASFVRDALRKTGGF